MYNGEKEINHKSRKIIYNYIVDNPGISFGNIKRFFEMNKSTLMYHLNYLEKSNKIYSRREGRQRCFYCRGKNEFENEPLLSVHTNLTENQKLILRLIKTTPGITKKELMERVRIGRKNLEYNIKRLGDLKLIWNIQNNGVTRYEYITQEALRDEVFMRLVTKLIKNEIDEDTFNKIRIKLEKMNLDELDVKR
jgi:predicted transcriptional regulator